MQSPLVLNRLLALPLVLIIAYRLDQGRIFVKHLKRILKIISIMRQVPEPNGDLIASVASLRQKKLAATSL